MIPKKDIKPKMGAVETTYGIKLDRYKLLQKGDAGEEVRELQRQLNMQMKNGKFDDKTEKALQRKIGTKAIRLFDLKMIMSGKQL